MPPFTFKFTDVPESPSPFFSITMEVHGESRREAIAAADELLRAGRIEDMELAEESVS
jgi:hypothetical protein